MQLKTVQEECPNPRMPTFSYLTIYCSPRVTIVHLAADVIPWGLCISGQQVPQLLVPLSNCLVVSLLGFLEHLLGLLNLHLAGHNIHAHWGGFSRTRGFLEILQRLWPSHSSLGKHPALLGQPLLIDDTEDCNNVCKVFLVVPTRVDGHTEVWPVWKLDLEKLSFFLGRDDVNHRYVWNGRPWDSCPFLHFVSFNPSGDLREVLILACCQSPAPSRGFLKEDLAELVGTQSFEWWLEDL